MGRILSLIFTLFCLTACNSYKSKLKTSEEGPLSAASIDYQFVVIKVLEPHCIRCHDLAGGNKGDVNLETYENVRSHLAGIAETTLLDESMPPKKAGGPLAAYEKSILKMWIDMGAPRDAADLPEPAPEPTPVATPEPTPTPVVEPTPITEPEIIAATWLDIYDKILKPKCVECHSEGEKAEDYPLHDKAYVIDPKNLMVVPGDAEGSEIYISITRQDKRKMPPPKTGVTLSSAEIEAIKTWILNGAKD